MEAVIKTTIARKNSEIEKLEQSKKSHLRMINSGAAKLRLKYGTPDSERKTDAETEARKIRMYETHNPGFCYLRNGECRKKTMTSNKAFAPDPAQCSEKIKAILFTDNELDIYKTMCLHLLGTHIQNGNHIQRKDGRLCSYVKAQGNDKTGPNTLQTLPQRIDSFAESPTKYDKMLPRYILDVRMLQGGVSAPSLKLSDFECSSDDESKKKRKHLVPIFINSEIRIIINSVLEALEAVDSKKLKLLTQLALSPEELRDMVAKEDIQEFITELANNSLVMKPTSYDFIMAHIMFDKIPDQGTLETVAQVLEVFDDYELKNSLNHIRHGILQRHTQLINNNLIQRTRTSVRSSRIDIIKTSNTSVNSSLKYMNIVSSGGCISDIWPNSTCRGDGETLTNRSIFKRELEDSKTGKKEISNKEQTNSKQKIQIKSDSEKLSLVRTKESENNSDDENHQQHRSSIETSKYDLNSLTNSERILLGLKVASLKSKPINMHQFEGKKKVDLTAIINPIIRPQVSDVDYKQNSPENHLRNFALPERKVKRSMSRLSTISTANLENLTRTLLTNLRLEISEAENKKRVNQFMATI